MKSTRATNRGMASVPDDLPVRQAERVEGGTTTTDGCASGTRPKPTSDPVTDPPVGPAPRVIISIIGVLIG
jgi:hypothetical protein